MDDNDYSVVLYDIKLELGRLTDQVKMLNQSLKVILEIAQRAVRKEEIKV